MIELLPDCLHNPGEPVSDTVKRAIGAGTLLLAGMIAHDKYGFDVAHTSAISDHIGHHIQNIRTDWARITGNQSA